MHHAPLIEDQVAALPMFAELRRRDVRQLMRHMTPTTVRAGRELTVEGTAGQECFLIVEGAAHVFHHGRVIAALGAGDLVGEIALLGDGRRTATVITDCETTLEVMTPRELHSAMHERPEFARSVTTCMRERLAVTAG